MKAIKTKIQHSALIKVGNLKPTMFPHACDTEELLIEKLEKHGLSVENIVSTKTHQVSIEKTRGRSKSKY
jgi:hypothetical protein